MDQLVAGVAIAAQQTIHRELPAGFTGVIIGDDDLLIFAACRLGHAVGTGGAEDIAMLSVAEVAAVLGISRAGAYELARSSGFPALKIGSRIVVPKDKFLAWIDANSGSKNAPL